MRRAVAGVHPEDRRLLRLAPGWGRRGGRLEALGAPSARAAAPGPYPALNNGPFDTGPPDGGVSEARGPTGASGAVVLRGGTSTV